MKQSSSIVFCGASGTRIQRHQDASTCYQEASALQEVVKRFGWRLCVIKWSQVERSGDNLLKLLYDILYICIPYTVYVAIAKTSWTWRNNSIEHPWGSMSLLLLFPIHHHLGHAIMINSIMLPKNAKDTNVMIEGREGILTVHNHASHRYSILYQEAYRCL